MGNSYFLTGRPGCGKTTIIRKVLVELARNAGGFYTQEIRERGSRKGFSLVTIDGREDVKADVLRALLSGTHPYLVSGEGTGKTRLSRSLTNLLPGIPVIKGCPYNDMVDFGV